MLLPGTLCILLSEELAVMIVINMVVTLLFTIVFFLDDEGGPKYS